MHQIFVIIFSAQNQNQNSYFSAQNQTQNAEKTGRKLGNQVDVIHYLQSFLRILQSVFILHQMILIRNLNIEYINHLAELPNRQCIYTKEILH